MTRPTATRHRAVPAGIAALLLAAAVSASAAQEAPAREREGVRVGVTLGGTAFLGLAVEYRWGGHAVDVTLGTWALRDASLTVVAKEYLGAGSLLPFVGAGFWAVLASTAQGTGAALALHAPIGADWRMAGDHYFGGGLYVNRALAVRRPVPEDDRPPSDHLVPLPGFYYRYWP